MLNLGFPLQMLINVNTQIFNIQQHSHSIFWDSSTLFLMMLLADNVFFFLRFTDYLLIALYFKTNLCMQNEFPESENSQEFVGNLQNFNLFPYMQMSKKEKSWNFWEWVSFWEWLEFLGIPDSIFFLVMTKKSNIS